MDEQQKYDEWRKTALDPSAPPAPAAAPVAAQISPEKEAYDKWREAEKARAAERAALIMEQAPEIEAASAIKRQRDAEKAGLPLTADLLTDPKSVLSQTVEQQTRRAQLYGSSSFAGWVSQDPINAALAQRDMTNLSETAGLFESLKRGTDRAFSGYAYRDATKRAEDTFDTLQTARADGSRSFMDLFDEELNKSSIYRPGPDGVTGAAGMDPTNLVGLANAADRYLMSRGQSLYESLFGEEGAEEAEAVLGEALGGALQAEMANSERVERSYGRSASVTRMNQMVAEVSELKGAEAQIKGLADLVANNPKDFGIWLLNVVAESAPGMAAGAVATYATRSPTAGSAVMGGFSMVTGETSTFDKLVRDAGYNLQDPKQRAALINDPAMREQLRDRAFAYGAVIGLMDGVSGKVASIALANNPVGNLVLQSLTQAVMGGGGEALGMIASGQDVNMVDVIIEGLAEMVTAPVEVAGVGGRYLKASRQVRADRQFFEALTARAESSETRKKAPGRYGELVAQLTKDGPVETLYVDAQALEELFQSRADGQTAADFISAMPGGDVEAFKLALEAGGTIEIKTSVYASDIVGTKFDALLREHLKTGPDRMSAKEAEALKSQTEQLMKMAERTLEDIESGRRDLETVVDEARQELVSQLRAAGRSASVAEREALQQVAFAVSTAERFGMPIEEFLTAYPLANVRGALRSSGQTTAVPVTVERAVQAVPGREATQATEIEEALLAEGTDPEVATEEEALAAVERYSGALQQRAAQPEDIAGGVTEAFLRSGGWGVVTATRGAENDAANNAALEAELVAKGLPFKKMRGVYKGEDDGVSYMVFADTAAVAELGRRYGQESILTREGLVFMDGSPTLPLNPRDLVTGDAARGRDFYSTMEDGTTWSAGFADTTMPELSRRLPDLEKTSPGPVFGVRELASRYMAKIGLPVRHQATYVKVDVERAREIARLYDEAVDSPNDPEVKAAYEALAAETIAQYEALLELGYTFEWITGSDPYSSPREAIIDMQENRHLWVFPTDSGFGTLTEASADNPLLQPTKHIVDGKVALVNDLFRIVHDVFGHGSEGASFGARGEENAWQAHVRMFTPLAARAMTSETRGQNSWVNFGPFGDANRADPKNTVFADQKSVLLPEWVSTVGQAEDIVELNQSGLNMLANPMSFERTPTVEKIAEGFHNEHQRAYGRELDPLTSEEDYQIVLQAARDELTAQLSEPNSGVGWYTKDVADAMDMAAQVYPTLATEVSHRQLFLVFAAIFSNGMTPQAAFAMSAEAFEMFLESGAVPTKRSGYQAWGVRNNNNVAQLQFVEYLVKTEGSLEKAMQWMLQPQPRAQIDEVMRASGFHKKGRYVTKKALAGEPAPGLMVLGEKLGRYAMGLHGFDVDAGDVTIDLWYTRTYRRMIGGLFRGPIGSEGIVGGPTDKDREVIRRMTGDLAAETGYPVGDVQALLWFFEKRLWGAQGLNTNEGTNSDGARQLLARKGIIEDDGSEAARIDGTRGDGPGVDYGFEPDEFFQGGVGQTLRPVAGRPQLFARDDGLVELTHWSAEERSVIDPAKAGTGPMTSQERRSGRKFAFYGINTREAGDPGTGYVKESLLGPIRHTAAIDPQRLYPWFEDPDGLRDESPSVVIETKWGKSTSMRSQMNITQDYENAIKAAGYAGYYVTDDGSGTAPLGNVAVVFEPLPVESARDERMVELFQSGATPDFYSELTRQVANAKQKSATAKDWIAIITKLPGVKKAELDWSGVVDWLAAQDGQIPRETVAAYLRDTEVEVETVVLRGDEARFDSYTETGGDSYQEVLLTVPDLEARGPNKNYDVRAYAKTAHFSEENVVVHARLNERQTASGRPVMFVEEVQSDLTSDWRKSGEDQPGPAGASQRDQLEAEYRVAEAAFRAARQEFADELGIGVEAANRVLLAAESGRASDVPDVAERAAVRRLADGSDDRALAVLERFYETRAEDRGARQMLNTERRPQLQLPQTPFEGEATYALMMKKLLKMAAENGSDFLMWTPGYMQARRWSGAVQNVVRSITYKPAEVYTSDAAALSQAWSDAVDELISAEGQMLDRAAARFRERGESFDEAEAQVALAIFDDAGAEYSPQTEPYVRELRAMTGSAEPTMERYREAVATSRARQEAADGGGLTTQMGRQVTLDGVNGKDVLEVDAQGIITAVAESRRMRAADVVGKPLSELLGGTMATQVMSQESGEISGQNIVIGGDGYKIAYDQSIKKFVDKFARKYGSKVEVVTDLPDFKPVVKMFHASKLIDQMGAVAAYDALKASGVRRPEFWVAFENRMNERLAGRQDRLRVSREVLEVSEAEGLTRAVDEVTRQIARHEEAISRYENLEEHIDEVLSLLDPAEIMTALGAEAPAGDAVWSVEITPEMREAASEAQPLFQRRPQGARGSILLPTQPNQPPLINLFEGADLSTFLHESGHYFLHVLQDLNRQGKGDAKTQADWMTISNWWAENAAEVAKDGGVTEEQVREYLRRGTTGDLALDRKVNVGLQEQWARAYESYLLEGKAPSLALRTAFEAFSAWLMEVYRRVKGDLNVNVSPELKGVFDRMLATDAEIARAAQANSIDIPLATSAEQLGVTPEEFAQLRKLGGEAQDEARQRLTMAIMAPIRAAKTAEYREARAKVEAEVTARVNARPANRVREWLGNNRWLGGDAPQGIPPSLRLSKRMLIDTYGREFVDAMPRGRFPLWAADGGLSTDEVAGWFGYRSGDEMIQDVVTSPKADAEIKAAVDAEMRKSYPDPLSDGSIADEAIEALHGDKRGQLIAAELRALSKSAKNGVMTTRSQAREIARRTITRMTVRQAVRSGQYLEAERRAAERSQQLVAEGKLEAAFEEKRKQLLNHALYLESKAADKVMASAEARVSKLQSKGTRKNLAGEYLEAIDEVLVAYDFRKSVSGRQADRRGALNRYVEMMTAAGRENELAIPQHVLDEAQRKPYKNLTVAELQGVLDTLINIEHTARLKKKLRDAQSQRDLDATLDAIEAEVVANVPAQPRNRVELPSERRADGFREFFNLLLNAETILMKFGGFRRGAMYDAIKAPIDAAAAWAGTQRRKAGEDFERLYSVYTRREQNAMGVKKVHAALGGDSFSQWDLISIALNMGNADNLNRLMDKDNGKGFNASQIQYVKDQLSERDWQFVQSSWNYINTFWPLIEARERRLTGVSPVKVQASEVVTPFGTLPGGYYPIKYSGAQSGVVAAEDLADIQRRTMAGKFGKAQTKNGHLIERAGGSGGRVLQLGIEVMHSHVGQVIHDLAFSEAIANSMRVLKDPRMTALFESRGLLKDQQSLEMWLQDAAVGQIAAGGVFGRLALKAKNGFTLSKLAFNISTVLVQVTGVAQSVTLVGPKNLALGYSDMISRTPWVVGREVAEISPFMAERETTFDRDINDILGDLQNGPAASRYQRFQRGLAQYGFWTMQKVQYYSVDLPTWLAAHRQGMAMFGNDEAKARAHADRQVARAQASGVFSDRSAFERGTLSADTRQNGFVRLFTTLGSYMFAKGNLAYQLAGVARRDMDGLNAKSLTAALKGAAGMVMLFTVEAVAYHAIKGTLPGMDDDDDDQSWAEFLAKETALSVMSTVPGIRDLGSTLSGFDAGAYGSILGTFGNLGKQALQGEVDAALLKAISSATGVFTGLPTGQLNKTLDAWYKLEEGKDISPIEFLMGANR